MKKQNTARLIIASSENCADLFWATRFHVPDPIVFFETRGKKYMIASDLEVGRAQKEADVDYVLSYSAYDEKLKRKGVKRKSGDITAFILKEKGIKHLIVPSYFPLASAENLKAFGFKVTVQTDPFYPERQYKTLEEKKNIIEAIRATEAGILEAIRIVKTSKIKAGKIVYQNKVLTSETLRRIIEIKMLENGALGQHTIVACGKQAADPHCRGTGPLYAHQTIVLDVFPKSIRTGYYGDVSRTILKGHASDAVMKMFEAVRDSQAVGVKSVRHGVDAAVVHKKVSDVLEQHGYKTFTKNGKPQGFIHSTGHGLGLDIHEAPRVSRLSNILEKGMVVTVEPGLYYEELGGVRIEDDVYVTQTGCENLVKIPKQFIL
ncbi:MAG: aminopeptidase P family protein [Deltaproteobacteria bacterium]|nr:MAG: aminopeptidase P family protein [Deltaproteobacteria bacterium]